ncbi:hypothetical protein NC652_028854 [Populus alba x Populus x berolinensis]|nr:hypothetical protein NC652_028854 [Populus alba x Populus x berolinensis]
MKTEFMALWDGFATDREFLLLKQRTNKRCYLLQPTDLKNSMKQSSGVFLGPLKLGYLIKERGLRS